MTADYYTFPLTSSEESPAPDEREGKQVSKLDEERLNRFLPWKIKKGKKRSLDFLVFTTRKRGCSN